MGLRHDPIPLPNCQSGLFAAQAGVHSALFSMPVLTKIDTRNAPYVRLLIALNAELSGRSAVVDS